jgi:hypothetical protein
MSAFKTGDRIRIAQRAVTSDDAKTGLYFSYFGGLTGKVDRTYDDGSVCVEIDLESLQEDTRERHAAMQEAERKRWLESLSDEARNRLTPDQRQLKMSYKLLVSRKDLEPHKGGKPAPESSPKSKGSQDASADTKKGPARTPEPPTQLKPAPSKSAVPKSTKEEPPPKRLSEADLIAAEEAFLRSRQSKR